MLLTETCYYTENQGLGGATNQSEVSMESVRSQSEVSQESVRSQSGVRQESVVWFNVIL